MGILRHHVSNISFRKVETLDLLLAVQKWNSNMFVPKLLDSMDCRKKETSLFSLACTYLILCICPFHTLLPNDLLYSILL